MTTLVFGDSTAYGRNANDGGWVQALINDDIRAISEERVPPQTATFNLGIGGNTVADIMERFEAEAVPRIQGALAVRVILAAGANDSKVRDGQSLFTIEQFTANVRQLVAKARHYSSDITLVGLYPIQEEHPRLAGVWFNERLRDFDDALRQVAESEHLGYVDLFQKLAARPELLDDGLHLTAEGHHIIYTEVKSLLAGRGN